MCRVRAVLACYRKDDYQSPEGFVVQVAALAETFADEVIEHVTNSITGIQTECDFPPTLKQFKDSLEYHAARVQRIAALGQHHLRAFEYAPRTEPGCMANLFVPVYAPRYAEMMARAAKSNEPREFKIDPDKCGQDWQGRPERRGGIHVALSWYRPDMGGISAASKQILRKHGVKFKDDKPTDPKSAAAEVKAKYGLTDEQWDAIPDASPQNDDTRF